MEACTRVGRAPGARGDPRHTVLNEWPEPGQVTHSASRPGPGGTHMGGLVPCRRGFHSANSGSPTNRTQAVALSGSHLCVPEAARQKRVTSPSRINRLAERHVPSMAVGRHDSACSNGRPLERRTPGQRTVRDPSARLRAGCAAAQNIKIVCVETRVKLSYVSPCVNHQSARGY